MEIKITGKIVKLNPIGKNNLSLINLWYRQADAFGYATGGKNPEEFLFQMNHPNKVTAFISGIHPTSGDNCIGLIAGEFKMNRYPVLWIKTFLIDTGWQRKHYGTHAFELLLQYAVRYYHIKRAYVSVSAENKTGISFWTSMGFSCARVLKIPHTYKRQDIFILEKVLR